MKKSQNKKLLTLLLTAPMVLGLFAGCGENPFEDSQTNQEGKYNISIACQFEDGEVEMLQIFEEAYEAKHPDVNVIVTNFGGQDFTNYMATYARNQEKLPMMLWMPNDSAASFAKGGYFLDLRPFYEADSETDYSLYYESMLHDAAYMGEFKPTTSYTGSYVSKEFGTEKSDSAENGLYFAPRDYNKIALVYNTKLFSKFDIEVPDTSVSWGMPEFFELINEITTAIQDRGAAYGAYRAISLLPQWEPVYTTILNEMGSEGLVVDGEFQLGSETNREIWNTLYDNLFQSKYAIDANGNFKNNTVFMACVSRPMILTFKNYLKDKDGNVTMDFLPFPAQAVGAGCSGYGITKIHAEKTQTVNGVTKTNKDLCWDFIKYIISEEGQELGGATSFMQPVLKSLEETGEWRSAFGEELNHDAWIHGEELRLTTYNVFEPHLRTGIRTHMSNFFSTLADYDMGAPQKRDELISEMLSRLNAAKQG